MTIEYCDICGKELNEPHRRYKVKREKYSWDERYWVRLSVHDECWRNLCKELANRKSI